MEIAAVPQAERLAIELDPAPILVAHAKHRRRFAEEVASLDERALATPSRCHLWTVADVVRHLNDVDSWMDDIWAGRPPPLTNFDPNTTPHEFVEKGRAVADVDVRDNFVASCGVMASFVGHRGADHWGDASISPVGVVPWWLSALHMFFDSWLHERDCLLPLGREVPVEEDELRPVLAYILGLAGLFGSQKEALDAVVGGMRVTAGSAPPVRVTVVDALGDVGLAADLADALSGRANLDGALDAMAPATARRLGALSRFLEPTS